MGVGERGGGRFNFFFRKRKRKGKERGGRRRNAYNYTQKIKREPKKKRQKKEREEEIKYTYFFYSLLVTLIVNSPSLSFTKFTNILKVFSRTASSLASGRATISAVPIHLPYEFCQKWTLSIETTFGFCCT